MTPYSASVLYSSGDLAFVRVNGYPCKREHLHIFTLADTVTSTITGEAVTVIGYPQLGDALTSVPVMRKGHVASTEHHPETNGVSMGAMVMLDLTTIPGLSGSPVILDATSVVVGVVSSGFDPVLVRRDPPTSISPDLSWATPITRADHEAAMQRTEPVEPGK
jgi:hypothetical protein